MWKIVVRLSYLTFQIIIFCSSTRLSNEIKQKRNKFLLRINSFTSFTNVPSVCKFDSPFFFLVVRQTNGIMPEWDAILIKRTFAQFLEQCLHCAKACCSYNNGTTFPVISKISVWCLDSLISDFQTNNTLH